MSIPLLLLHGAIGSKQQLLPLHNLLQEKTEAYSLNFSGHGGEQIPTANFSMELFADDVLKFLDEKKLSRVNIFGYSMGGYVALYLAKHFPERVNKIITLGTKFYWDNTVAENECKKLIPEKIELKIPEFAEILKQRHEPQDWKLVLEKTRSMMFALGNKNMLTENDYKTISHNCLICIGENDEMVTRDETVNVSNWLPNAQLHIIPNTTHPVEKVGVGELAGLILDFSNNNKIISGTHLKI